MAKTKNAMKTVKKSRKDSKFKSKHYPCSYCSKTFTERAGRDHHLQLHSSDRPFTCPQCPHTCKTKKYLAKHVRVVHKPPTSYKCEYCDKMFHYKCILDKHIVVHTNSKPHKCKECGKGFNSQYSLRTHTFIHKDLKPFQCQYCDYACRDSSTLRRHHERHLGIVRRHHCDMCDRRFSKKEMLQRHIAEVHLNMNLKKIPCALCDGMFKTKSMLKAHVEIKHNRKYATSCDICGMKIANKYNMNTHLMSHVDIRPYKCGFSGCDKRYKDRSTLQKHSIIHYPDKQFPCKICGKRFTRKARLRKHKNQHVKRIKNVQCDYCGVCFYNKNYLKVHIMKKHGRRKRKYICDMCDFESGNKPGLIIHIKGHYVRTDKQCPMCTKKYKQEKWLRFHLLHAHKVMEVNESTLGADIKVEPIDVDGIPEFELFEVEKEEILDELHSIESEKDTEKDTTESITEISNVIEEENENFVLSTKTAEDLEDDVAISRRAEPSKTNSNKNRNVGVINEPNVNLTSGTIHKDTIQECAKEILCVNEELRVNKGYLNQAGADDVVENIVHFKNILEGNVDKRSALSNPDQTGKKYDLQQSKEILAEDENRNLEEHIPSQSNHEKLINLKDVQSRKAGRSKRKCLAYLKTKLIDKNKEKAKENTKRSRNNIRSNGSKRTSLADLKAALLAQKESGKKIEINSDLVSESEEFEQGIEYSKAVLSEDITRCITQRKKKVRSEKNFDDFFIENIVEIDKDSQSYANDYIDTLLKESRNNREIKLIEKTRQQYNERIRKGRKIRSDKVSIKYFDKKSVNQTSDNIETTQSDENAIQDRDVDIDNEGERECNGEIERSEIKHDKKSDIESDNLTQEKDYSKNIDVDSDFLGNEKGEKETNKIYLRSGSRNKKCYENDDPHDGKTKSVDECRKIKLNTHQCYVCFKLFDSKEKLLDHCKDHFDVCNTTILKKCPLCDFATKLNIVRHMKAEHNVEISIPSTRIIDKESGNGSRYCYKVNSASIKDIDVIPSVKHLNKQAYIDIDKKNRKLKDTGIAKTKLVKKGKEWIVERQTTNINNVEEFILPEFDVDEILSIKINSNDYLSRMKKLYQLAKKHKRQMLFPCESCDKICQTVSALKLHCRRHDPESKPFKKKVWKHKMKDFVQPTNKKVTDIEYGSKKYSRVVEIDKNNATDKNINANRYKKPKPVVNKHKCDPELIKFYETNIKGGDIEFWQFLKIFNKMSRENVNDFDDLNERPEFGIHMDETNSNNRIDNNIEIDDRKENETNVKATKRIVDSKNVGNTAKSRANHLNRSRFPSNSKFKRIIRISKRDYQRRNCLIQRLRDKIAKENLERNV